MNDEAKTLQAAELGAALADASASNSAAHDLVQIEADRAIALAAAKAACDAAFYTASATCSVAMSDALATAMGTWASAQGTPEATYQAALAAAQAAKDAAFFPAYATYMSAYSQADTTWVTDIAPFCVTYHNAIADNSLTAYNAIANAGHTAADALVDASLTHSTASIGNGQTLSDAETANTLTKVTTVLPDAQAAADAQADNGEAAVDSIITDAQTAYDSEADSAFVEVGANTSAQVALVGAMAAAIGAMGPAAAAGPAAPAAPQDPNNISIDGLIVGSDGGHAWIEFYYDLSRLDSTLVGPHPVIIRVEMTGPGWEATAAGIQGVPGKISVSVWQAYGTNARSLPTNSTTSTKYRHFTGDIRDADRLIQWIDKNTRGDLAAILRKCFFESQPGSAGTATMDGAGDFTRYGVPAFGGRQHCSTFAGFAASLYTGKHWLSLFGSGPMGTLPGGLMIGPIGPPWSLYPDLALPPR